jgi:RNA polymerase sigma-70 factor (ECF subfamily)
MAEISPPESPPPDLGVDASRAQAVERLFNEHNRSLVSYLALRLRSVQEAKEVAQEAYVRVLQLDRPGAESFLKAYLFRVATNLAVDRLRHRQHQQRHELDCGEDIETGFNAPERATLVDEQCDALFTALQELPEKYRDALLLFRLEGLNQHAIAARLHVNERTVREYINHALRYCRMRINGATPEQAKEGMKHE